MEQKSGQPLSPCVVINGRMLADVSGDEIEAYLVENNLTVPLGAAGGCPDRPWMQRRGARRNAGGTPLPAA